MIQWPKVLPPLNEALMVAKSRWLAMPGRLAQIIAAESDPAAVEEILRTEIEDSLKGLKPELILAELLEEARRKARLVR